MSVRTLPAAAGAPAREDGTPWSYALFRGGDAHYADIPGEIIGAIVPGYADLPDGADGDTAALLARWEVCVATANELQQLLAAAAVRDGTLDVANIGEDALGVLFADRVSPIDVDVWDQPVPLVLLTTDYDPYADRTPPGRPHPVARPVDRENVPHQPGRAGHGGVLHPRHRLSVVSTDRQELNPAGPACTCCTLVDRCADE